MAFFVDTWVWFGRQLNCDECRFFDFLENISDLDGNVWVAAHIHDIRCWLYFWGGFRDGIFGGDDWKVHRLYAGQC